MTAEIAIMNREAVALAADSAITISQGGAPRIYATANKLFALSRHHPVGIMVYGNASFMEVPWETVIKLYRARLGGTAHATIQDYTDDFVEFLQSETALAPSKSQDQFVRRVLDAVFTVMVRQIQREFTSKLPEETPTTPEEFQQLLQRVKSDVIGEHYRRWRAARFSEDMDAASANELRRQYRLTIKDTKEANFGADLETTASRQLTLLAGWVLSKHDDRYTSIGGSGVVIAGFGEEQLFPSLRAVRVAGIAGGKLNYGWADGASTDIGTEEGEAIVPFAQGEMVRSFMEGIEPGFRKELENGVKQILEKYPTIIINSLRETSDEERKRLKAVAASAASEMLEVFKDSLDATGYTRYVEPVISTIASMPKSELPAVAEALVNLQSFKRRVSGEQETVGGPIDVMLISKGDGLIWIQRKHYFDANLNPQYFQAANSAVADDTVGVERTLEGNNSHG